ncbi:UPF0755 protein [Sediminihabitans luteus]|uniref:Endolytic murein transglycosylase n=1 Tax=Sediminihabitans luteus TaxID=1138585 RepID=A0A2M9CQI1_9CELL|nr:endolytic transglycosylase MltG [Sediminihabitans luteus]PJJ74182.1 UPF0755 protein [Sediminihabitans luteus]GII99035.1 ABC transporter substrate-binding protein [Sediminihabitans luteus]
MSDLFPAQGPAQDPEPAPVGPQRSAGQEERRSRRRRTRRRRRTVLAVVLILVILGCVGWVAKDQLAGLVDDVRPGAAADYPGPGEDPVSVTIETGATGEDMGAALHDADVVASTQAFVSAFQDNPQAGQIQPGTHEMLTKMSAKDAVARLVANQNRVDIKLTIPEGFTVEQILERAVEVTGIPRDAFDAAMKDPDATGLPAQAKGNFEGWLFPTTYSFEPDVTATQALQQMVQQTLFALSDAGAKKADYQDVLIEASLIEREAKRDEDRPKMAAAIDNRLAAGDYLRIDASVAYGAGKPGTELTQKDLDDASNPYNLYEHPGFPPGPIASPGRPSIDAVLHPADDGTYYYFWLTVNLDTGETVFSSTQAGQDAAEAQLDEWLEENG